MDFEARVVTGIPAGDDDAQYDDLIDRLPGAAIGTDRGTLTVYLSMDAPDVESATAAFLAQIRDVVEARAIEVFPAGEPPEAEWIPTSEAAEMLGVSRQALHQMRAAHPDMPSPRADDPRRLRWPRAALRRWADAREKRERDPGTGRLL